jgi:hypothetical protein
MTEVAMWHGAVLRLSFLFDCKQLAKAADMREPDLFELEADGESESEAFLERDDLGMGGARAIATAAAPGDAVLGAASAIAASSSAASLSASASSASGASSAASVVSAHSASANASARTSLSAFASAVATGPSDVAEYDGASASALGSLAMSAVSAELGDAVNTLNQKSSLRRRRRQGGFAPR